MMDGAMPYKFFAIPADNPEQATRDLNQFLARHRILRVELQFGNDGGHPCWYFCVDFVAGPAESFSEIRASNIDYKEVLDEKDFALFSRLRALRKEIAEAEGVPLFAVFTNEQLAELAKQRPSSPAALKKIRGIGEKKIQKFGARFLAVIAQHAAGSRDETSERAVARDPHMG